MLFVCAPSRSRLTHLLLMMMSVDEHKTQFGCNFSMPQSEFIAPTHRTTRTAKKNLALQARSVFNPRHGGVEKFDLIFRPACVFL